MPPAPRFLSALSTQTSPEAAVRDLASQVAFSAPPDLALVFFSAHFTPCAGRLQHLLQAAFQPAHLAGVSAESVLATGREVEGAPAVSLMLAWLPGISLLLRCHYSDDWNRLLSTKRALEEALPLSPETRLLLLFGDPFSTPMSGLLDALNEYYPGLLVAGGMASAAGMPGGNRLLCNGETSTRGLAALAFSGDVRVDTLLSQGCRPVGEPLSVTLAHRNVILRLENQPATAQLQQVIAALPEDARRQLGQGLYLGRATNPQREAFGRGDFVIRPIIGLDQRSGAIALGDFVRRGDVVQFFLQDAATAREDLEMLLLPHSFRPPPAGALLFTCSGRGTRLYDHPDGDIRILHDYLGADLPISGFFGAGEIGAADGKNFLHGHAASVVLFR